jgi:Flp pilus assembly protein TadD
MSNFGICATVLGNVTIGIEMMSRAVALQPNSAKLRRDLGEMLRRNGRFAEAEAAFRASLRLNPNNPDLMSLLGLTQVQQGDLVAGLNTCQTAVTLANRIAAARGMIPATYFRLGFVLVTLGKKEDARAAFAAGLALNPRFGGAQCLGISRAEMEEMLG